MLTTTTCHTPKVDPRCTSSEGTRSNPHRVAGPLLSFRRSRVTYQRPKGRRYFRFSVTKVGDLVKVSSPHPLTGRVRLGTDSDPQGGEPPGTKDLRIPGMSVRPTGDVS